MSKRSSNGREKKKSAIEDTEKFTDDDGDYYVKAQTVQELSKI